MNVVQSEIAFTKNLNEIQKLHFFPIDKILIICFIILSSLILLQLIKLATGARKKRYNFQSNAKRWHIKRLLKHAQ